MSAVDRAKVYAEVARLVRTLPSNYSPDQVAEAIYEIAVQMDDPPDRAGDQTDHDGFHERTRCAGDAR